MDTSSDPGLSIWPYIVLLALAMFIVLNLMRPCEPFRIKMSITNAQFGWTNTICAPLPYQGTCHCTTVDSNDPWTAQPGSAPSRASDRFKPKEVKPEVVF